MRLHVATLNGCAHGVLPGGGAQLAKDVGHMRFDRPGGDPQPFADYRIAIVFRGQFQYLDLADGKGLSPSIRPPAVPGKTPENRLGDISGQYPFALVYLPDRFDQLPTGNILEYVATNPNTGQRSHILLEIVRGQYEHPGRGLLPLQGPGDLDAGATSQAYVKEEDVWGELLRQAKGFLRSVGLSHHLNGWVPFDESLDPLSNQRMVLHEQDLDPFVRHRIPGLNEIPVHD